MDEEAGRRSTWSPALAVASVITPLRRASLSNTASIDLTGVARRAAATARRLAEIGGAEVTWRLLGENAPAWRLECSADERGDCPHHVVEELIALTTKRAVTRVGLIRRRAHRGDDESDPPSHYIEPSHLLAPLTLASGKIKLCGHVDLSARVETALNLHAEAFDREPGSAPYTDGNHFARIGLVLMNLARAGATEWIGTYIRALPPTNQAAALQGLRQTAGDDHELRPDLAAVWPAVMKELEDGLTHDDRWVDVHAELVPSVRTDPYSLGSGDAWNEATANWIDPVRSRRS